MGENNATRGAGGVGGAGEAAMEERIITWEQFKELFFEKYFPANMADCMKTRFLELKQGNMTVVEYDVKFNELTCFAPHQVNIKRKKARRREQGLKPWLFNLVAVLEIDNYAKLVEKTMIIEGSGEALSKFNKGNKMKEEKNRKWNVEKTSGESINNRVDLRRATTVRGPMRKAGEEDQSRRRGERTVRPVARTLTIGNA